jgi:hypothetical protein
VTGGDPKQGIDGSKIDGQPLEWATAGSRFCLPHCQPQECADPALSKVAAPIPHFAALNPSYERQHRA